jgi:WKF domain
VWLTTTIFQYVIGFCQRPNLAVIMPSATIHNTPTHVPAWKRLGLKLKSQVSPESAPEPFTIIEASKRKREDTIDKGSAKKTKKISKTLSPSVPVTPILVRKKSVTFTPETKADDGDSIKHLYDSWVAEQKSQDPSFQLQNSQPALRASEPSVVEEQVDTNFDEKLRRAGRVKQPKQKQDKKKSLKSLRISKPTNVFSRPYLQYLRQYHESRDTWKFNKNHQSHLLKHVFDIDIIPSDHVHLICPYVRGLQGGVRTRLRDAALAIKIKDQEEGPAGFPENMADADKKQREYDAAMKKYVEGMIAANASSTVGYEEGVLLGLSDASMAKRVAKRTRAEQILAELETAQDPGEISKVVDKEMVNGDNDSQKRLRMNDGSTQKVARRRKQRTAAVEDDTSSSESDDSGEDSSDDSVTENGEGGGDDTSSSSSSSSSGSEEDSGDSGEADSEDSSGESEDDDE